VVRAAPPLALALGAAWGLGAVGLPGAPLAGAGALAAFAVAAYGWRGVVGPLLLAACAAGQVAAGEDGALAAGAGVGAALGFAAWAAAVRLFPEGHLASRRRARRLDSGAKVA
jgi:hypothetical protein